MSRRAAIAVGVGSAMLGGAVSGLVSSAGGGGNHFLQLSIALTLVVLAIVAAGTVFYYQRSLRQALHNQDEAQMLAGLGSWERDLASGTGYWSKNRYRLFGMKPRAVAPNQEEFYSLLHPDDREQVRQVVSNALANADSYETIYRLAHDPLKRTFISRGKILRDEHGKAVSIVGTSQDITEKLQHDRLTESLISQKDLFISRLGHDLNTPLTPLVTLLPMVRTAVQDEKQLKRLDLCISSVAHLRNLVSSSMQLARRFQPLRTPLAFGVFSLHEHVDGVLAHMQELFIAHAITSENRVDPQISLYADSGEVETVFFNLFNNAIKFSERGSTVIIDAVKDNCSVNVSVTDSGAGLNEAELPFVFDEFYKADASRHELGSSGLGLSICRQIILNHGGLISASSPGKGFGTTITFTLLAGDAI